MSFLTSADSSNSKIFVDVWLSLEKSIAEFSNGIQKNECPDMTLVYNDDFGLQSRSTPQGLFRYLGCATHFLFDARALSDT